MKKPEHAPRNNQGVGVRVTQGSNGPDDKGNGTTHAPHPKVGTNNSGGLGAGADKRKGFGGR